MGGEEVVAVAVAAAAEKTFTRKIVVGVDESEESMYALSWCLNNIILPNNSPNSHDELVLLHVKRPVIVYPGFDKSDVLSHDALSSLDRRDSEMARWVLQRAEKLCLKHDVNVEEMVKEGDPGDVICEMVDVLKADLLVMGTHGYGHLTRALLRSVSNHCVQNANCPVLVVKMPKK